MEENKDNVEAQCFDTHALDHPSHRWSRKLDKQSDIAQAPVRQPVQIEAVVDLSFITLAITLAISGLPLEWLQPILWLIAVKNYWRKS